MIVSLIAILCLTTVNGQCSDGCPFPTFTTRAVKFGSQLLENRVNSKQLDRKPLDPRCPGDEVTFICSNGRQIPTDQSAALVCQQNGKWNATLPRCGKYK